MCFIYFLCRYLAPEYAEDGTVSVRIDVYAYGIVLLQLISGRKANSSPEQQLSLRQWVFLLSFMPSDIYNFFHVLAKNFHFDKC